MTMPEVEVDDQAVIQELQQRINQISSDLGTCQQLTDQMCDVLNGFQQRLSMLESTMLPIHKQTQSLTIAQKNIDRVIEEVDLIQANTMIADTPESKLDERSISHNLEQLCSQVNEILAARAFFQARQYLPYAAKHIQACQALLKRSIKSCENEFKLVIEADSKKIDFNQLPWPLPTDYQSISSSTQNKLGSLAACLQRCSASESFIKQLIQVRTDTVRASLETASSVNRTASGAIDSLAEDNQRMAQKMKSKLLGVKKKISSEQYERGSHAFIKFMQFLLFLIKMEQSFIQNLFALTDCPSSDMRTCITSITNSLFDCVIKEAEELMTKKSDSKVLILLDILDNLNSIIDIHKLQQDLSSLKLVAGQFVEAIQKAIEYRKEKTAHSYSKQQSPVDGGYDTITIQTMNFISRLFEYRSTIESSSPPLPKVEVAISLFLVALDSSLEQKARSYKNTCLMHVFLMNNANYILRNIRNSPDLALVISKQRIASDLEQRFKSALEAYRQATWSKLLSYIDKDDFGDLSSPLSQAQKKVIKQSFSGFNATFEELYSTQKQFSVPDSDLRSQLRNTNVEIVVPRYHAFLEKFSTVEFSNHPGKYIKYHVSVFEQMLNKFFDEEA